MWKGGRGIFFGLNIYAITYSFVGNIELFLELVHFMQISSLGFSNTFILNCCLSIHFCTTLIVCLIFYLYLQYPRRV
jgi:hypothetical protein